MKKILATLLVFAMVASVCGMLFVSAGNPAEELKAELEALVGADNEAAVGEWNIDVTVAEDGKVTAVFNTVGLEGDDIVVVEAPVFYDAEKLTLLNAVNSKDNSVDCVTTMPDNSGDWENFCRLEEDGVIILSLLNVDTENYINDTNLVFTLEFQLAEGENLAGLYIPTSDDNFVCAPDFESLAMNGAYGIVCTIEEEPEDPVEPELPTNLAAGKEWTGDTECGSGYKGDITDGKIDPDGKYDQSIWYGFDQRNSGDSVGTIIIDLGAIYTNIDEIRAHVWPFGGSGIAVPQSYEFYVSEDGETYTLVTSVAGVQGAPTWVGTDNEEGLTARYVKLDIVGTAKDTFWFIGELEVNSYDPKVVEVAVPAEPGNLAAGKEWTGDTEIGSGYKGDITDGKIDPDGKYDTSIWYGFDQRKSGDSVGTIIIDLGKLYSGLDEIRAFVWHEPGSGIAVPQYYNFYISEDGETYTLVTSVAGVKSAPTWVGTDNTETLTARYIKLDIVGTAKDTFWFIGELEVNVFEPEIPHEHVYNKTVTVEPSLVDGVATYTCECGDSYTEAIPAVKVQPETLETLPEGALVFDYAGYVHDSFFCIVAGDNLTVNELTALGNNGAGKDMNYFYVIVVDENGVVVETHFTLGRPDGVKSDVVCPAGGYIIAFNGNKAGADELTKVEVGAEITLYNIDVEALRGVAGNVTVKDAGFTYENPAPVEPDEPSEPEVSEPDEPSEPEVSEPEEPSEEPSEDDSSELPPTSDAGVLVFAILGVLAIVGAAVVIKVRN